MTKVFKPNFEEGTVEEVEVENMWSAYGCAFRWEVAAAAILCWQAGVMVGLAEQHRRSQRSWIEAEWEDYGPSHRAFE